MPQFKFSECLSNTGQVIKDLYIIEPTVYRDARGYFMETFNNEFLPYIRHLDSSQASFIQDNESHSRKGVLRGLHFQKTKPQAKLVRVIEGEVYDVAVDLRSSSCTYGSYYGVILSAENKKQFFVPEGFAHGFLVLSDTATFVYKCTRVYAPEDEGALIWNDPDIGIKWPHIEGEIMLSNKDELNPTLKELAFRF